MIAFLRQLVFKDFWLKLFSFGLATLIWFTVSFVIDKEAATSVPGSLLTKPREFNNLKVLVVSSTADVRDVKVDPGEVTVTVDGDAKTLDSLQEHDIRPLVDLTGLEMAGPLRRRVDVSAPPGIVHILSVSPDSVQVLVPASQRKPP